MSEQDECLAAQQEELLSLSMICGSDLELMRVDERAAHGDGDVGAGASDVEPMLSRLVPVDDSRSALRAFSPTNLMSPTTPGPSRFANVEALRIRVVPVQEGNEGENHVAAYINAILTPDYPDASPLLNVTSIKGLDDAQLAELNQRARDIVVEARGYVVMFDVMVAVRDYLVTNNKPEESLHDQMTSAKASKGKAAARTAAMARRRSSLAQLRSDSDGGTHSGSDDDELARAHRRHMRRERRDSDFSLSSHESLSEASSDYESDELGGGAMSRPLALSSLLLGKGPRYTFGDSESSESDDAYEGGDEDGDESERGHANESEDTANTPVANTPTYGRNKGKHHDDEDEDEDEDEDDDDDDDGGRAPWRRTLRVQVPKNTFERGGASGHSGRGASVREVGIFGSGPARKKGTLRAGKKHRKKRRGGRRKKHAHAEDESTSGGANGGSARGEGGGGGGGGGGWLGPLSSVVSGIAKTVGHTVGSMLEKSRGAEVWNMAARPELSSSSTAGSSVAPSSARDIPGRPESGSSTAFGTTPVTAFGTTPVTPFGTTPDDSLLGAFHAGEDTRARAYSTASTLPSDDTPCLSPMLPSREVQAELETTFRLDLDDDTPTGSAGLASSPELPRQHRRVLAMLHLLRVFARQNGLGAGEWRELVDHLQDIGVLDQIPQASTWDAQQVAAKLSSIFHDTIEIDAGNRIFNKFWNANNIHEETSVDHDHSRYRQDFVEVYRLGKGGGGTVFKVRNKLDGRFYAVKKVPLSRHEAINNKMLREVTTLSSLYHQHVVRYYQAWIEGEVDSDDDGNDNSMLSAMDEAEEHDGLDEYSTGTYSNASPALGRDNSLDWMFPGQQSWLKPEWVPGGEASSTSAGAGSESPSRTNSQRSLQKTAAMRAASGVDRGRGVGGGGGGDTAGGWTESGGSSMVEWDSSTQGVGHYTDEAAAARRGTQLLYIQMEFCPMTLRDYISSGRYVHNSALYWRHFRQILGGLAHMHSKGIIHRDLKPCNIFFDAAGDLKIGDFGLATVYSPYDINTPNTHVHSDEFSFSTDLGGGGGKSVAAARAASAMAVPRAASDDGVTLGTVPRASPPFDIDVTTGIGTWFYTSPEQMRGTTYNEKVDMYSLGIIFFEMVQPFSTMQERADMLDSLRDQHECPKGFVDAHITEASIINSLISREPRRRPSPQELLRSPILPAQLESEVLDDALKTIFKQIDSVHYDRMLENLFSITTKEDLSNKLPAKTPSVTVDTYALRERVVRHVKEVFRRVGAVPVHTPLFVALDDATMTANRVLDSNGKILFMRPTDQRIAFCNYCAEQKLTFLRRYDVNTCYKSRKGNAGAMKDYEFASYDILGGGPDMIADADVIKVTHSVLAMFRELGRATIRVSHMGIVKWLLERGKVPASKREDVLRHLASWRSEQGWSVADAQLAKLGVGVKARRFLGSVVGLTPHADQFGTVRELRKRFKKSKRIQAAADDLERLLVNLDAFGMIEDVTVDLSFVPSRDHYDGVVFECMLVARHPAPRVGGESSRQAAKRKRTVVGLGGRYDKLLKERYRVWSGLRDHRTVCGVTIDVGILVRHLERQLMQGEDYHLRDTMVLVVSAGKGLHTARLHVLRMLWGANIRAETMYSDNPQTPEQIDYCSQIGARVMVIIKEREWQDGHGSVWVRLVRDKERDVCVRMPDLIRTLSQMLSRVRRAMAQVHTNSTE